MRPRKERKIRQVIITLIVAFLIALALGALGIARSGSAHANPNIGCETIRWGFLGSQRRTICDTPRRADGSWDRARIVWTPAHHVPFYCSGGLYYSSCSGGYDVDMTQQARETYVVFDSNVLPDEPGWLPPGTDVLR